MRPIAPCSAGLALLALLCCVPACSPRASGSLPESAAPPTRLLLVGLDAADWQIADPLIEAGRLPNLARLRRQGSWGDLRSGTLTISPALWTSIATGKPPDQHGIIDFLIRDPRSGQDVPITSTFRKTKALWNIFSEAGLTSDFIGWWATWPAETVNGHMVSDRFAYTLFGYETRPEDTLGLVYPPDFLAEVSSLRVGDDDITLQDLRRFGPFTSEDLEAARQRARKGEGQWYEHPVGHFVRVLASTRTYHAIALKLLREGKADILSVYYQAIDEVCHRFAHYIPPRLDWVDAGEFEKYKDVVARFYEYQDELLGQLVEAAGPEATVVVLSDHGFLSRTDRPDFSPHIELKAGRWHRPYGVIVLSGPGIRADHRLAPAGLKDVAPTILYLAGLPVADDMEGRPILDAVTPEFRQQVRLASIPTYDGAPAEESGPHGDPPATSSRLDEEITARLRSLGYVTSGGSESEAAGTIATRTNLVNLAMSQIASGDHEAAEESARSILTAEPDDAEAHFLLSEALESQGRLEEALEESRAALSLIPQWEARGQTSIPQEPAERLVGRYASLSQRLGRLEEARVFLERYVELRPESGEPWLGLGMIQSMSGEWRAAEASFLRALRESPRSAAAVAGLWGILEGGDGTPETLETIREAIRENPDSAAHRSLLGMIHLRNGENDLAEKELRKALELDPGRDSAIAGLGDLLADTDRAEEALAFLEGAAGRPGAGVETRMALGRLFSRLGRLDEARQEMSEAARMDPASADAQAQLGLILAMQNEVNRAIPYLERALELDPDLYDVRIHLAVLHHEQGNLSDCEAELKRAVARRPTDPRPHRMLVSLYRETGRPDEAEKEISRMRRATSKMTPSDPE